MSDKEKEDAKDVGEDIGRIREFAEKKGLPEETIDDFVAAELKEHHEKSSAESWLDKQTPGSGDVVSVEGFLEAAGDVLRNIVKGKKPEFKGMKFKSNSDNIKRTYGNPSWVKSRRLMNSEVTLPLGALLAGDIGKTVDQVIQQCKTVTVKNEAVVKRLLQQCMPIVTFLKGNDWKDPAKLKAFRAGYKGLPIGAKFNDIDVRLSTDDAKVHTLDVEGVVKATELIFKIREVYYGDAINPFKNTDWDKVFWVHVGGPGGFGQSEYAWRSKDPYYHEMMKYYAEDKDSRQIIGELCEDLGTFGYGVDYDWSENSRNGSYELSRLMRALIAHIDASVR